jgi:rare lipoprotein A
MPILLSLFVGCAEEPLQQGLASWYGPGFEGNLTASGDRFDPAALTGAHLTLPFGSIIEVRRPDTAQSVSITINDRGPHVEDRILDLSPAAAEAIGLIDDGIALVEILPE